MIDFNTEPYFDDFTEDNKFYRILFRPTVAVQARELNQIQSILQNQIKQQGDHLFKNGTRVIPGEFSLNFDIDYVKLASFGGTTNISDLIGSTIKDSSGLEALIIHAVDVSGSDPATLYVSYTSSSNSGATKTFSPSTSLTTVSGTAYTATVASSNQVGKGSLASVKRGVYYVNGEFVLNDEQTIVIDRYNAVYNASNFSTRVGFNVVEEIITQDSVGYESLLDNAQGSYNYGAPGAHRYFIDLVLTTSPIGSDDKNFVELARLIGNSAVSSSNKTEYSELEKTLARRTFDESGNYSVNGLDIDVREHRDNNRGTWSSANAYIYGDIVTNGGYIYVALASISAGGTAPTHSTGITNNWQQTASPAYNRGIYPADATNSTPDDSTGKGNINKLAIGISSGKAYVQGYEIEKVATSHLTIDKPRETAFDNNASIATTIGNYVQVTNIHKLPAIDTCPVVTLYDQITTSIGVASGSAIGTCRIRGVQNDGTNATNTKIPVRLYLFDVKMNAGKDFARDVKSFYWQAGGSPSSTNDFTADVTPDTYSIVLSGGITTSASSTTVTGTNTRFQTELKVGDYVYYLDDAGTARTLRVNAITDNTHFTLAANAPSVATAVTVSRVQTSLVESQNTSLVFPLPHTATSAIADHIYWVIQQVGTVSVAGNTLNVSVSGGTFESDITNYYVQDANGQSVNISSVVPSSGTAAITFASTPATSWSVWATVRKTGVSARKTKTITAGSDTFTSASGAAYNTKLTLTKTDCFKLVSIISGGVDITDWYSFDNGQKASYYDYGSVSLLPSSPTPSANVTVNYQYFAHSSGDFFDLASYPNYDAIPSFNGINLRDTIDFRPTISNISLRIPKRGYNISADLTYYLPRRDKIALDILGNFFDIKGSSSVNPGLPDDSSTGMTLCTLDMLPYIFNVTDATVTKIDNKRYTMRDIGKLEKRIDNLEYYTTLSLLEQETAALTITDASGLNRFKNGFIVDNFTGHDVGNVASQDYLCSVDMKAGELRPFVAMDNINLTANTSLSTDYKLYGDVITLPLDPIEPHVVLAKNEYATRTEFVNPFAIFSFIGDVKMNPSSDDWFEVERRPDIVQNVEGNYNTIATLAEKAGALGTVWNSWQTQWMGEPWVEKTYWTNGVGHYGNWSLRTDLIQVSARQVGQSRTGINTSIKTKIDTQVVDDKVLSTAVIPYIRSRNILIQVAGLKPNTRFYPFFDGTNVSSYCTPARIITYTPVSGKFDTTTNIGELAATATTRQISGDSQVCLNTGDVITGSISGATAVVVGKDIYTNPTSGAKTYNLYVVNVKGTFSSSDTITGSISGATGTSPSISAASTLGDPLLTSASGSVFLLFKIPNTDSVRFRTGSREFKLMDVSTNDGQYTSKGRTTYNASGVLQTKQSTVVATRNAELVQEVVSDTQTIVQKSQRVIGTTWYDPLAQTFLVENDGGAFLSKVDLFFATMDSNIPVTIEIREVINGYPGKNVLPFSRVTLQPDEITLSNNTVVDSNGVSYPSFDAATTVTFPSPVYVQNGMEYALVVLSDSNRYKLWISQMGEMIPGTTNFVSEQPYAGVLFKSQNGSSWTASQEQDMKFTIWRANFDTSVVGNVVLTNDKNSRYNLESDPFQTLNGSTTVRVWHRNHGFKNGDSVTIDSAPSLVNGATVNGTFTVSNVTLDSYTIVSSTSATATSFGGGTGCYATRNIKFETAHININTLAFPETTATYSLSSLDWNTPATVYNESCIVNDNNYFNTPRVVNSTTNALKLTATLTSNNKALSPIIDTHRASVASITNVIDAPSETNTNVAAVDRVTVLSGVSNFACVAPSTITAGSFVIGNTYTIVSIGTTDFTSIGASSNQLGVVFVATGIGSGTGTASSPSTITTSGATNIAAMQRIIVGSYIELAGMTASSGANNGKALVTAVNTTNGTLTLGNKTLVAETANSSSYLYYYSSFFDEITPVGSSTSSKYVSKEITLAQQSSIVKVKLSGCIPTEADVLVYYKTGVGAADFSKTNWTLLPSDIAIPKVAIGSNTFYDIDFTSKQLPLFDKVAVKLVMKSTNTAAAPRLKDLRIIACI